MHHDLAHTLKGEGHDASEDGTGRGVPLVATHAPEYDDERDLWRVTCNCGHEFTATLRTPCPKCGGFSGRTHGDPVCFGWQNSPSQGASVGDVAPTLDKSKTPSVAFNLRGREGGAMPEECDAASLRAASGGSSRSYVAEVADTLTCNGGAGGRYDKHPRTVTNSGVRRLTPRECERLQGFPDDYTLVPHRKKPAADGPRYKALGNSMAVPVMRWIGARIAKVEEVISHA